MDSLLVRGGSGRGDWRLYSLSFVDQDLVISLSNFLYPAIMMRGFVQFTNLAACLMPGGAMGKEYRVPVLPPNLPKWPPLKAPPQVRPVRSSSYRSAIVRI